MGEKLDRWPSLNEMVRINLIVEGQTEEAFVKQVLADYMASQKIFIISRSVETGRKGTKIHRGGMTKYSKAKKDIKHWPSQDQKAYVSTMFDLYRLPDDFPGMKTHKKKMDRPPIEKNYHLETQLKNDINDERFIPYLQLHEFEALLFSDPKTVDERLPLPNGEKSNLDTLMEILKSAGNDPELINERPNKSPSKRIASLYPRYQKVAYGSKVLKEIGIKTILQKCTHFKEWIEKLLNLRVQSSPP